MAVVFLRLADHERAAGGGDDVVGDDAEPVDLHDAVDLGEQAVQEPEVAAGDAADSSNSLGVGEVVEIQGESEALPVAGEDEGELVVAEGPVLVGETDAAVE